MQFAALSGTETDSQQRSAAARPSPGKGVPSCLRLRGIQSNHWRPEVSSGRRNVSLSGYVCLAPSRHDTLTPILDRDRPIGLLHATAMVAGIIIGASIFVQPSEVNRHVPTVGGVLSVWTVAGILTLFGALVCAQLSAAYPRTGGVYVFLQET